MQMEENVLSPAKKVVDVYLTDDGIRYFRISWRDTWEPESHLISCEKLLEEFWKARENSLPTKSDEVKKEHCSEVEDVPPPPASKTCKCGKPQNISKKLQKKTFHEKSVQHNESIEKCESGIQVNTYKQKTRNRSVQCSSRTVETGTQCESTLFQNEVSTQFTPELKDSFTQNVVVYQDECNQFESSFSDDANGGIYQKEASVQFSPDTIECGIQNNVSLQDQFTQCNENVFQKTVACQYAPNMISCGVQKDILYIDKCSQYECHLEVLNTNKTGVIATQQHTNHICNDISKQVVQLHAPINSSELSTQSYVGNNTESVSKLGSKVENSHCSVIAMPCNNDVVDSQSCIQLYSDNISSQLRSQLYNNHVSSPLCRNIQGDDSTAIVSQSCQSDVVNVQPCARLYQGNITAEQSFLAGTQGYTEIMEEQALDFNTTVDASVSVCHVEEKVNSEMKEMIFVADAPFDIQHTQQQHHQQQHTTLSHESGVQARMDAVPSSCTDQHAIQDSVCVLLTTSDESTLNAQESSVLAEKLLFQSAHGCMTNQISQTSTNSVLTKDITFQSNNVCLENQGLLDSRSMTSQHFIFQSGNENHSPQAAIFNTLELAPCGVLRTDTDLKFNNDTGNIQTGMTMQLLNESFPSLERKLIPVSESTPSLQKDIPTANVRGWKCPPSQIPHKSLQVSDPSEIMCPTVKQETVQPKVAIEPPKGKRKRNSSDKTKGKSCTDNKVTKKSRKKKNVVFDNCVAPAIGVQTSSDDCLPMYDHVTCASEEERHINMRMPMMRCVDVSESVNLKDCGDSEKKSLIQRSNSCMNMFTTRSSEEKNINDDFISKYWK